MLHPNVSPNPLPADTCVHTQCHDYKRQKRRATVHKLDPSRFLRSLVMLTLIELVEPAWCAAACLDLKLAATAALL